MASNIENKQSSYHQPQQQRPPPSASARRHASVCTENVSEKELVRSPQNRQNPKNILKNTAHIILPIIKRRGESVPPPRQRDLKSGSNYLGPPDLVKSTSSGKRRGSSVDSSRRPSITTFLEEEMKPSAVVSKPIFSTPQLQRKSLNTSRLTLGSASVEDFFAEDNGGVYLGPSSPEKDQKVAAQQQRERRQTHPNKMLKRQETKMSIVCSMLGYLPQREFVETGYDPTEVVLRQRLESIDSPAKSRPSLTSAAIAPTFKTAVASVLVRQESSQSVGTNPRKSMCPC